MSSIKNNLGLQNSIPVKDKKASGIAKLMTEVNQHKDQKLTIEILCYWHKILLEHNSKINAGVWRAGVDPVQVVSGAYGSEEVQYEAPPSNRVPMEMEQFLNGTISLSYGDPRNLEIAEQYMSNIYKNATVW